MKDQEGDLEQRIFVFFFFFNKRHMMRQHLDPAGVFMKILMSDKFKTVYKQSNVLLVCGHVSYNGNARVAVSQ